jgi:hypothetical protein
VEAIEQGQLPLVVRAQATRCNQTGSSLPFAIDQFAEYLTPPGGIRRFARPLSESEILTVALAEVTDNGCIARLIGVSRAGRGSVERELSSEGLVCP